MGSKKKGITSNLISGVKNEGHGTFKDEIENLKKISENLNKDIVKFNEDLSNNYDIYNLIRNAHFDEAKNFYSFIKNPETNDKLIETYCRHKDSYLTKNFYYSIFCLFKQLEILSKYIDNLKENDTLYKKARNDKLKKIKGNNERENLNRLNINDIIFLTAETAQPEKGWYYDFKNLRIMKTIRDIFCHGISEEDLYDYKKDHLKLFNENRNEFYHSSVKVLYDYVNCIKKYSKL